MELSEEIRRLLEEMRDIQREHLAEYQRVTQRSLDLQKRAVERQEQISRLYQRVIAVAAVLVGGLMILLLYFLFVRIGLTRR